MSLRKKITGLILLVVLVGIVGTLVVSTRSFVVDKHAFVMELSAIATPSIAAAIALYLDDTEHDLARFDEIFKSQKRPADFKQRLQARFEKIHGVEALEIHDSSGLLAQIHKPKVLNPPSIQLNIPKLFGASEGPFVRRILSLPTRLGGNDGVLVLVSAIGRRIYIATLGGADWTDLLEPARALSVSLRAEDGSSLISGGEEERLMASAELLRDVMTPLRTQEGQPVLVREYRLPNAESAIRSVSIVPNTKGLEVITQVRGFQLFRMSQQILRKTLPVTGIIVIFAMLISVFLSSLIVKPIEALTEATAQIALGDWRVSLKARGSDEISRLAQAFSKMGAELESREVALKDTHSALLKSEQLATLGKFGAGLAHEVKNPLQSIQGFTQLLQNTTDSKFNEDERKYLKTILDETRRANRIISDLLIFSKQKSPTLLMTDVREVVNRAYQLFHPLVADDKIEFENEPCTHAVWSKVDQDQLLQVLQNLLDNGKHALQAKPTDHPRILRLETTVRGSETVISVIDNGGGISDANKDRLFQPFFSTKGVGKGTGLGLATCHGIVHQHGGKITVSSTVGQGSTFQIHLPGCQQSSAKSSLA